MSRGELAPTVIPRIAAGDLKRLTLGSVEAFVLSQVDGRSSIDDLSAVTGLAGERVSSIVLDLHAMGAVVLPEGALRSPPPSRGSSRKSMPAMGRPSSARSVRAARAMPSVPPTAVPRRVAAPTSRSLGLSGRDGFVLAQIDGHTSVADLGEITGLGMTELLRVLVVLEESGVIAVKERAPAARKSSARHAAVSPPRTPPPPRAMASSHRRRSTARMPAARVSSALVAPPPPPEVEKCELDDATQKRILDLHARVGSATHYELLAISRDADKKDTRRAFHAIASALHPDRHFGKKLGPLKPILHEVFVRVTIAHDTLRDPDRRAAYDASLPPPSRRPGNGESLHSSRRSMEPPAGSRTRGSERVSPPSAAPRRSSPAEEKARRETLATRLSGSPVKFSEPAPRKSANSAEFPDSLRRFFDEKVDSAGKSRSRVFVEAAEYAAAKGDVVAAAAQYHLAMQCAGTPEIRAAFEAAEAKARTHRMEAHLKQARIAESAGRWAEAANRYAKAYAVNPEADVAERLAHALVQEGGDARRAVKLAEEAVAKHNGKADYHATLAEACLGAGLAVRARAEAQRAITLAPAHERAKSVLDKVGKGK